MPFTPPPWARQFSEDDLRLRPHAVAEWDRGLEYGYWWIEWGGCLDTIKDNEQIRDELLSVVLGAWDHVKNGGDHGAENWALEWFGFLPGKRESRRFVGQYVLSESDVMQSRPHEDAIAYGGWPIDLHPPEGVDAADQHPCVQHKVPHLFDIPLRCCVSQNIFNLMFAGRNFSATHVAFASTRVMATCAVVGQGVGTAAAWAVQNNILPCDLVAHPEAVRAIQKQLARDDVFLIGDRERDSSNLALQAVVSATSQTDNGPAVAILSGQNRSVHGELGAPPARARAGTHRWMSDPRDGLPAAITLSWPSPITAAHVQLVFDTGLHRVLTFSLADAYTQKMLWGQPQPETVKDYLIEARLGATWRPVALVAGNYQRLRRHRLDGEPFDRLRITVTATQGIDHARICEVRVDP